MRCCGEPVGVHIAAGTFPGTFYHSSLFFSTHELTYGYSAVSSATALSQVRRRVSAVTFSGQCRGLQVHAVRLYVNALECGCR